MDRDFLNNILFGGLVLIASVFASKATSRFGVPILLIFIVVGMLLGIDGPGGIAFNDFASTNLFGTIALIYILFAGGLSTLPGVLRPIWKEGVALATAGVFLTAVIMTGLIHLIMDWSWMSSALLATAVSSTDAAAVFGILRTQRMEIQSNIRALVELESGSNDPMAVVLMLLLLQFAESPHETTMLVTVQRFFVQIALGGLCGWFLGKLLVRVINFLKLEFEGLYPVLTTASVMCIYSFTEYFGGNGYLAVFVAGLAMSGSKFLSKKSLLVFHDGLSWIMQVGMFLMLGLLVNPSELSFVMEYSVIFAIFLIFFARPLAVYLTLLPWGPRGWRELAFISWGGMKGAVAIILATYLLMENVPHAKVMFNVIFFVVFISMALQGSTMRFATEKLKMNIQKKTQPPYEFYQSERNTNEFIEFEVTEDSTLVGKTIFDLKLPEGVLVVLVHRDKEDFIPKGSTTLEVHDKLVCLLKEEFIPEIVGMLRKELPFTEEKRW